MNGACGPLDQLSIVGNTLRGANGPSSIDDNGINGWGCGPNITNINYSGNTVYNIGGYGGHTDTGAGIMIGAAQGGV